MRFILYVLILSQSINFCFAKQHESVENIIKNIYSCQSNFTPSISESENINDLFNQAINKISSKDINLTRKTLLLPVNNCVLRSDKGYVHYINSLENNLFVSRIVNFDLLLHHQHKELNTKADDSYIYLHFNSSQYPQAESLRSLVQVLNYLSEARPHKRVLLTCFFGVHRTGLISAIYQFIAHYAIDDYAACQHYSSEQDNIYNFMINLSQARQSIDIPHEYKEFYKDFVASVCEENSHEFLEAL